MLDKPLHPFGQLLVVVNLGRFVQHFGKQDLVVGILNQDRVLLLFFDFVGGDFFFRFGEELFGPFEDFGGVYFFHGRL